MAPAVHDSDSNDSNAEAFPGPKSHGASPEQDGQSDQDGPEDSGEEGEDEVYEIEAILDAKRGATGSVRFLGPSLRMNRVLFLFQDKNRLPRQVERLYRRRE